MDQTFTAAALGNWMNARTRARFWFSLGLLRTSRTGVASHTHGGHTVQVPHQKHANAVIWLL